MGLFVRNEHTTGSNLPLYNLSLNKTILVVGLGNIGTEYDLTRHNIGFYCLDQYAVKESFDPWANKKDLKCQTTTQNLGGTRVILCKPTTFMNNSGEAVQAIQHFYKISPADTLVIHDELDIPFGQIRLRAGGSSAGHNGLKSLIEQGSGDSPRVRIGIHNAVADKADSADFVLGKFTKDEQAQLPDLANAVSDVINEFVASGQLPHDTRTF